MRRCGVTLAELLVSLAILGALLAVVATTFRPATTVVPPQELRSQLRRAQSKAAESGAPVTLTIVDAKGVHAVTVAESGFVTGDSSLHLTAFTDSLRNVPFQQAYDR